jgi:hypothetical protein
LSIKDSIKKEKRNRKNAFTIYIFGIIEALYRDSNSASAILSPKIAVEKQRNRRTKNGYR